MFWTIQKIAIEYTADAHDVTALLFTTEPGRLGLYEPTPLNIKGNKLWRVHDNTVQRKYMEQ